MKQVLGSATDDLWLKWKNHRSCSHYLQKSYTDTYVTHTHSSIIKFYMVSVYKIYVCVHAVYVWLPVCGVQRSKLRIFLYYFLSWLLKQGLLLNLDFSDYTSWSACPKDPPSLPMLPNSGVTETLNTWLFMWVLDMELRFLHSLLLTEPSSQPR